MPQIKFPTTQMLDKTITESSVETQKTAAQILLEKKITGLKSRNLPPHVNPRVDYKGKKIGPPPRGTRKSMGKR